MGRYARSMVGLLALAAILAACTGGKSSPKKHTLTGAVLELDRIAKGA